MYCLNFVLVLFALLGCAYSATKSKCDVVKALRAQGVPDSDLRDWLCLVAHESRYRYDVIGHSSSGSNDYGIFQLSDIYSCGKSGATDTSTCWRIRTYGCHDTCNSFIDTYITNDAKCAVRIKNCDGFKRWYGWKDHCSNVQSSDYDYSGC